MWNGKIPWMLKALHGTIDFNSLLKGPLLLRVIGRFLSVVSLRRLPLVCDEPFEGQALQVLSR